MLAANWFSVLHIDLLFSQYVYTRTVMYTNEKYFPLNRLHIKSILLRIILMATIVNSTSQQHTVKLQINAEFYISVNFAHIKTSQIHNIIEIVYTYLGKIV